tara:strand:+ start:27 stop:386 length:360 start_codon:yes stop_codon:yes gene_type:complete
MTPNPFSSPTQIPTERGVFGDARLIKKGFLYRVVEFETPFRCQLIYNGWWFRQTITLNGHLAWSQISWLTIERNADFDVPEQASTHSSPGKIEIEFGRTLMIRRFRIWIDNRIVYDEVT